MAVKRNRPSETDLKSLKALFHALLELDIQPTKMSPLVVKHPFTDSGIVGLRKEDGSIAIADLTSGPASLHLWREQTGRLIDDAENPIDLFMMITKPYKLGFLKYAAPYLSEQDIGEDEQLFVFEAPIDMLSYITLNPDGWERHSYVACCGTSSIPVLNMLDRPPQLRQVFLCLDNDEAGHSASQRMAELIADRGISTKRLISENKDWNEDLVSEYEQEGVQMHCQMSGY